MQRVSQAFRGALVEAVPKVRRFAYALSGSPADADDLLQATLERALAKAHLFEAGTRLESWLFRLCRNIWIDEMRARRTRGVAVEIDNETGPSLDGERATMSRLTLAEVQAAMRQLSEDHRAILALVGVEGLSYREAAAVLGLPIGTVMSRLARARAQLLARLGPQETTS